MARFYIICHHIDKGSPISNNLNALLCQHTVFKKPVDLWRRNVPRNYYTWQAGRFFKNFLSKADIRMRL